MNFNWIDWVIVGIAVYFFVDGWSAGFFQLLANFIAFLASLWLAVRYHALIGNFLGEKFGIPALWTKVIGYLLVAIVSESIISEIAAAVFLNRIPAKLYKQKINQWLGGLLAVINGLVFVAFFLLVILSLPLRGTIKQEVKNSVLGSRLVRLAERYGGSVTSSLEQAAANAVKFITIEPTSSERIPLDISPKPENLQTDSASEERMFILVNEARTKAGVGKLTVDGRMAEVARAYSRDMFLRHYFSHYDPEGHNVVYRMEQASISFTTVGENLAYAPDVETAHQGLMNSPGHRRNILDPEFDRAGIGIIDGGIYGKMFVQIFAD